MALLDPPSGSQATAPAPCKSLPRGRSRIPIIDLFAGAGGLSIGATDAGGDVRVCVELDPVACRTLRAHEKYHGRVLEHDVAALTGLDLREAAGLKPRDPLIIVGGAPCQPFSKAAYWVEEGEEALYRRARAAGIAMDRPPPPAKARPDERRTLIEEFWRLIFEANADGFVFENVPSIKHPRNRPVLDGFRCAAEKAGYDVSQVTANAAEHGVAQTRERVFLLGAKQGKPKPPRQSHALKGELGLKPAVTAGEALQGFDSPRYFEPRRLSRAVGQSTCVLFPRAGTPKLIPLGLGTRNQLFRPRRASGTSS